MLFPQREYVNLKSPDVREFTRMDPNGFLHRYQTGVIIDEIKRVPELLSYIQVEVDIILDYGLHQDQVEIKLGQTTNPDYFKGLAYFSGINSGIRNSYLIYTGTDQRKQQKTEILNWQGIGRIPIQ